jgi:hypothetical protein
MDVYCPDIARESGVDPYIKFTNERWKFFCEHLLEDKQHRKLNYHFLGLPNESMLFEPA